MAIPVIFGCLYLLICKFCLHHAEFFNLVAFQLYLQLITCIDGVSFVQVIITWIVESFGLQKMKFPIPGIKTQIVAISMYIPTNYHATSWEGW